MFTIDMLPAHEGDALWIEYGPDDGPPHRILIDCGRKKAYRAVAKRLEGDPEAKFELFVLTHVDADHIEGAVPLLQDRRFGPERVGDVWFNGWRHLNGWHRDEEPPVGPDLLGAKQGEFFGALLRDGSYPWNEEFAGRSAVVEDMGELPEITLGGGMKITLLSPTRGSMTQMRDRWQRDLGAIDDPVKRIEPGDWETALRVLGTHRGSGPDLLGDEPAGPIIVDALAAEPFDADSSEPNGSSIAFLAEFDGRRVLFAADAHAPLLADALRRLAAARGVDRIRLDAFKMSHHASARNNSTDLLRLLDCQRYLISTNGSRHHHPDREALARVLAAHDDGVEFVFNYRSEETASWDDDELRTKHGYSTIYPDRDGEIRVTL